ncbi:MAG: pyruvate synthase [Planctomycetia bacterium]|nr:pyruvate synthase [Planctomycetia bacterium]
MVRQLLTGNAAAAWGARLARAEYVPAFPITPQTEIIETLADWFADGSMPGKFVTLDSEHSMLTAAGAAAATGVRTFAATSSQGLVYALEVLYSVAGWRVPLVLVNVSRGLSAPITLGPDHNDVLAARDTGFVQLHAETCQEVLDSVLLAYRIAEDARVSLPVLVNLDGFFLSFTREPVEIPEADRAREFLGDFTPVQPVFRASRPVAQGVAVLEGGLYSYFRYQMHRAVQNAVAAHTAAATDFERLFGRRYGTIESYRLDGADVALVMAGSFTTKAKAAVERWRSQGRRVGVLRLRMVRPFPAAEIAATLAGCRAVGVIDQNLSPGLGGIFFHEVAGALAAHQVQPPVLRSFIGGLGGKDISQAEFDHVLETLESAHAHDGPHEAELLFTRTEWDQVRNRLALAGKTWERSAT